MAGLKIQYLPNFGKYAENSMNLSKIGILSPGIPSSNPEEKRPN
jgi:hypothetical protein